MVLFATVCFNKNYDPMNVTFQHYTQLGFYAHNNNDHCFSVVDFINVGNVTNGYS